jgi:hypothetical protein
MISGASTTLATLAKSDLQEDSSTVILDSVDQFLSQMFSTLSSTLSTFQLQRHPSPINVRSFEKNKIKSYALHILIIFLFFCNFSGNGSMYKSNFVVGKDLQTDLTVNPDRPEKVKECPYVFSQCGFVNEIAKICENKESFNLKDVKGVYVPNG